MTKAMILEKSKYQRTKILDYFNSFTNAFGDSIHGEKKTMKSNNLYLEIYDSIENLEYFSIERDKKNLKNDFNHFTKDFRKATEKAKSKVKHGETFTAK